MRTKTVDGQSLTAALADIKEVTFTRTEVRGPVTLTASATAWRSCNEMWSLRELENRIAAVHVVVNETLVLDSAIRQVAPDELHQPRKKGRHAHANVSMPYGKTGFRS